MWLRDIQSMDVRNKSWISPRRIRNISIQLFVYEPKLSLNRPFDFLWFVSYSFSSVQMNFQVGPNIPFNLAGSACSSMANWGEKEESHRIRLPEQYSQENNINEVE